ncbi:MAG: hypothetical protein ACLFUH_09800 [Bacteroidales bacterium]
MNEKDLIKIGNIYRNKDQDDYILISFKQIGMETFLKIKNIVEEYEHKIYPQKSIKIYEDIDLDSFLSELSDCGIYVNVKNYKIELFQTISEFAENTHSA